MAPTFTKERNNPMRTASRGGFMGLLRFCVQKCSYSATPANVLPVFITFRYEKGTKGAERPEKFWWLIKSKYLRAENNQQLLST